MNKNKKIVLAYSGGLDTSYCAKYLSNCGFEVHAVSIDTGGFSEDEINRISKTAYLLGVKSYKNINAVQSFYELIIRNLVFGNILRNNTYPLSVSSERVIQALEIMNYARSIGASYIAHGSTGAGNDQVRFDLIFQTIAPEIEVMTPIRDRKLSRQEEIEYLNNYGISLDWQKAKYSINKGLWGTSIGGEETLTSNIPLPEDAYPSQLTKTKEEKLVLTYKMGELVAINGDENNPVISIAKLNEIASQYAIGRDIHTGDTIIGIKGRVGFEAAAPIVIIKAHHALEKHVLTKWQQQHKDYMSSWYGMLLHEGQYLDPVMRDIEAFLESSQKTVSGEVYITLKPYHFSIDGVTSSHDLMDTSFANYGETNSAWTAEEAKGFIKIYANQNKLYHHVNKEI